MSKNDYFVLHKPLKLRDRIINLYKIFALTFLLLAVSYRSSIQAEQDREIKPTKAEIIQNTQKLQIPFIANKGQTDERVMFYANSLGGTVSVTKDGEIIYSLSNLQNTGNYSPARPECYSQNKLHNANMIQDTRYGLKEYQYAEQCAFCSSYQDFYNFLIWSEDHSGNVSYMKGLALKEELLGGKIEDIKGERETITKVNYFKGKDPSRWRTNISTYEVVNLGEVYKGIDLKLKAHGNNVEKFFYVKPDTDPEIINLKLSGAKTLRVNEEGQLEAETDSGTFKFTRPWAYQEIDGKRVEVHVEYDIQGLGVEDQRSSVSSVSSLAPCHLPHVPSIDSESATQNSQLIYGFKVATYDRTKDLVINPLLASTYLGGNNSDSIFSIAIDSGKNIYVAGYTRSIDFPTIICVYDTSYNDGGDAFIAKFSGDLINLLGCTFFGGSSEDAIWSIAIDSGGDIYVTGYTWSSDFPTIAGAYDTSFNGGYTDAFVSKFNGALTNLLASSYFGGSLEDYGYSITIDFSGNIYLAGRTLSSDFPITSGAYEISKKGHGDVFVSKLKGDLTSLSASTFLGGALDDAVRSMTIDSAGNIYVAGRTGSLDFPTTTSAYDTSYNGDGDGFVSMLKGDLTSLLASTFLGGSSEDFVWSIIIHPDGNIYVAGKTSSLDFPTTTYAYDTVYSGGDRDAFVSKLSANLTNLLASTFLGGVSNDHIYSLTIDSGGNIYVTGETSSSNFPTTADTYDISYNGGDRDAFISKLNSTLTDLLFSTYLGGSGYDYATSIAIDSSGNIYTAGFTKSSDFPTTANTYDTSYNSDDAFVSKFVSNLITLP